MRITARSGKRVVLYVAAVLGLWGAFAGRAEAVEFGQYYEYVSAVEVGNDNHLYIAVLGNFTNDHGCAQPWFAQSAFPLSDDRTKAWMQLATVSLLSHTKVYIQSIDCTAYGHLIMDKLQLAQ